MQLETTDMALKIIPAGDPMPITSLMCVILGNPGTWKTSLANTAEAPLLLAFDVKGARRSLKRPDTVAVETWKDIEELSQSSTDGRYKTLIIDTAGRCIDAMAADIMLSEPKLGRGGQLTQAGYGRLKSRFRTWANRVLGFGVNVVFVAHALEDRQGDEVRLRLDAMGSSKEFIYQEADMMGRTIISSGQSFINWDPSESGFGKNPAGLPAEHIPQMEKNPDYLAQCIRRTVEHLSRENEATILEEKRIADLYTYFKDIASPDEFSKIAKDMVETNQKKADRDALLTVAKDRGWQFDRATLTFTDPNAKQEEPVQGDGF